MWKFLVMIELQNQKLDTALDGRNTDPEVDQRARNLIWKCLGLSALRKVMKLTSAKEIWDALEKDYQSKTLPNKIYLRQRYHNYQMDENKSIDENLDVFLKLIDDMASVKIEIDEVDKACKLLMSLPRAYEQLAHTLKYGNGKDTLTMSDVTTAAFAKETELHESGSMRRNRNNAEGLFVQRGRPSHRGNRSERGSSSKDHSRHKSKEKRSKSRPKTKAKVKVCWICDKEGHFKNDCPLKRDLLKGQSSANVAHESEFPMVLTASVHYTKDEWVLDSGCSFHITPNRDVLFDFQEVEDVKVLMGNNTVSEVKGMGKMRIINPDKTEVILTGVRYVPTMVRNLISYGQLEKNGCNYEGNNFSVNFYRNGTKVISGKYKDGLYYLNGSVIGGVSATAKLSIDSTTLWHSRLGHMSEKRMKELVKQGQLEKKDIQNLKFCEDCVLGKSQKQSFPKGKHTSTEVLEYVHSDLWGSPGVEGSLSGCKYFITFIDDFSRKVWIRFLRSKDEAFEAFKTWKQLVETQTGKKVKCLRTDNGLEYCNKAFDQLCSDSGIKRHNTCVYTPQQNGVSERMNRTIMNKVRCMLAETGLRKQFWAEAAATAVYLINMSPSSAIDFDIPEERWSGKKISLKHLRRFGCVAYVHTVQDKVSPRALKGYFMGYPVGVKGYRVWIPEDGKSVISRNVTFHEDQVFKDNVEEKPIRERSPKKVTFDTILIHGPTNPISGGADSGGASSGGASSGGVNVDDIEYVGESSESAVNGESESMINEDSIQEVTEEQNAESGNEVENLDEYLLARDRTRRVTRPPSRFEGTDFVAYALSCAVELNIDEPRSVGEAKSSKYWKEWEEAMKEEMNSLHKNHTWDIVEQPSRKKLVGSKWIYKFKEGIPGVELPRFKARLVAKGFTQVEGIDFNEIFAPVVKHVSIRVMLSIVVNYDLELDQLDVKTAFLHGTLDEEIYMRQPEGFVQKGQEDKVCLLKKSLYGLKQSPRQWNQKFDEFMTTHGYNRSIHDPCVYHKGGSIQEKVYLLLYVDDMLIASKDKLKIQNLKRSLSERFEMKDLGAANRILGMDIVRDRKAGFLKLSQEKYLRDLLRSFNMQDARPVVTPVNSTIKLKSLTEEELLTESKYMDSIPYASAVGSLMYAMIGSRPDLGFAICLISRYMSKPGRVHWEAVKWVLKYLVGAKNYSLTFTREDQFEIVGFCDSDYATDLDRRRSVSGYVFQVGGNTVSWRSTLQHVVALSTTEAEYMALTEASKEGIWLMGLCKEMGFHTDKFKIFCDSQSAICLAKNSVHHDRTKHIDIKVHFIRDKIKEGIVQVLKIHTSLNPADMLTKSIPGKSFEKFLGALKVLS